MREKLIELLQSSPTDIMGNHGVGALADHLVASGVTFAADNKWIPVTERLPKPLVDVLSYSGHKTLVSVNCVGERGK
jgi:hypothetical protein